ncbi:hypothetical protein DFJ74DRAFT_674363 [Hyaloraphidium curvatum]|nr:hypothetical protein DFJ74DRAFT_674363 [Hyaloraphidium curvatum]
MAFTPRTPRQTPYYSAFPQSPGGTGGTEEAPWSAAVYAPFPASASAVTLAELHGELLTVSSDEAASNDADIKRADEMALNRFVASGGVLYPHIQLPTRIDTEARPPPDWVTPEEARAKDGTLVDPMLEFSPADAQEYADRPAPKAKPPPAGSGANVDIFKSSANGAGAVVTKRHTPGGSAGFSGLLPTSLEALFANLLQTFNDRVNGWSFSARDYVKSRAEPLRTGITTTAEQYRVAGVANYLFGLAWRSAEAVVEVVIPAVFPGGSSPQARLYHKQLLAGMSAMPVPLQAWHPTQHLVAFLHSSGQRIFLHSLSPKLCAWIPPNCGFSHPLQTDVTALEWRPMRGGELAVACRDGVLLWLLAPTISSALAADPARQPAQKSSPPSVRIFVSPAMTILTSLAFSPSGTLLAVGGTESQTGPSDALCVWDLDIGSYSMVGGGLGGGTAARGLAWSADGLVLVQACTTPVIRIFETKSWTHKTVRLDSPCVSLAIAPDSRTVLYSTSGWPAIQLIALRGAGSTDFKVLEDRGLSLERRIGRRGGKDVVIGGPVKQFAIDPKGERMAVFFEPVAQSRSGNGATDVAPGSELVLLYALRRRTLGLEFAQLGYILADRVDQDPFASRAPALPSSLAFARQFARGALLSIPWSSGKVSMIPLMFS